MLFFFWLMKLFIIHIQLLGKHSPPLLQRYEGRCHEYRRCSCPHAVAVSDGIVKKTGICFGAAFLGCFGLPPHVWWSRRGQEGRRVNAEIKKDQKNVEKGCHLFWVLCKSLELFKVKARELLTISSKTTVFTYLFVYSVFWETRNYQILVTTLFCF